MARSRTRRIGTDRVVVDDDHLLVIIGFLPARTKARLEAVYGVDPVATTFQSVFCEFLIAVMGFALLAIGLFTSQFALGPILLVALVAAVDGGVRYGRILAEERPPPGFCEWAWPRRLY